MRKSAIIISSKQPSKLYRIDAFRNTLMGLFLASITDSGKRSCRTNGGTPLNMCRFELALLIVRGVAVKNSIPAIGIEKRW